MNAGQLGLRRALASGWTIRTIAHEIDVSPGSVSHWASGVCVPTYRSRQRLHALLGIELDAWEREGSELIKRLITEPERLGS